MIKYLTIIFVMIFIFMIFICHDSHFLKEIVHHVYEEF